MSAHHPDCERDEGCADYECGRCEACSFDFKDPNRLTSYAHRGESGSVNICELCTGTQCGNEVMKLHKCENWSLLQSINYIGNKILQRLEEEWTQ